MRKGFDTQVLVLATLLVSLFLLSGCFKREAVRESPLAMGRGGKASSPGSSLEGRGPQAGQPSQPQASTIREEKVAREKTAELGEKGVPRAELRQEGLGEGQVRGGEPGTAREEGGRVAPGQTRLGPVGGAQVASVPPPGGPSPLREIYFEFDRYDLKEESKKVLQEIADWMMKYPGVKLVIEGHTDERGTDQYNLALGERRAISALSYLRELGVSADRLNAISYGEMRPAYPGSNEEAWSKNRRDAFAVAK